MKRRSKDPYILPSGDVCISQKQLKLHKTTEFLSFTFGSALLLWTATRERKLKDEERLGLAVLGIGAAIVDTHLWLKFRRAKKKKE
jgi:hypothetical protein